MVVDVGCGAGLLATKLSRHRVVGVDFSAPLLAAAVRRAASVAMASAFALPFRDASAAAVVCLFVFVTCPNVADAYADLPKHRW
jgi:ubiquinone/menaquinone biosynthesis C-methylase UbiE